MKKSWCAVALLAVSGAVFAQNAPAPSASTVDQRQANQEKRIDQGVASGSLNPKEANRLERGQQRVDNMEQRALANDGQVGTKEAKAINKAQNVQSKRIYRQKHDRQHAKH